MLAPVVWNPTGPVFVQQTPIKVIGGAFTITLEKDYVYTLSTVAGATKGAFLNIPNASHFFEHLKSGAGYVATSGALGYMTPRRRFT